MRPYQVAEPYDVMTERLLPYNELAAFLKGKLEAYRPQLHRVLDIACGSGNLTLALAGQGLAVMGLDISPEMVARAREKAEAGGYAIAFACHDMSQPYPEGGVDGVVSFYGGLNFLTTPEAVQGMFAAAYGALVPGGVFAFDQFREAKMRAAFAGVKAHDFGGFYVTTNSRCDAEGHVVHRVNYFLKEEDGRYRRVEEEHHIQIYPFDLLADWLTQAGFILHEQVELYPVINAKALQDTILFVAQKPEG